jgi:RNA polymerase sigma factor (sigma-70 family)
MAYEQPEHDDGDKEAMYQWIDTCLTEREREVIQGRLEGKTLVKIGDCLGVTRDRARQIEEKAIAKLRQKAQESQHSDQ